MHWKSIKFHPKFWCRKLPTAIVFCLFGLLFITNAEAQTKDYTRYVNPFIGTGGHGHTFPGAALPHGMVQLSPDTRVDNWDGSSGYHYSDNEIFGFSHTHLSGTGIPDYCDILLMPTVGEVDFNNFKSTFSHANEKAEPGYYSVKIDNGVTAELTATTRVGFHRYTFPKTDKANIILDLKWRDKVLDSELSIVSKTRVEGYRRSQSWAKDQIVYFVAEFSKPIIKATGSSNSEIKTNNLDPLKGKEIKNLFQFQTSANEQILVKVAISSISIEGARKNLTAEIKGWNFEKVRSDVKAAWNKELSKIEVSGGSEAQMTNFYTALYHTKIAPNVFQDVDGNYLGLDKKTHNAVKDTNYTIFSLWDTFRAAHPLYTITDQKRTVDFINTFIRQYEQGGRLPVWELAGNETDCMIGYHAVPVIADAMAKGIKGFDYKKAFEAAKQSAELNHFGLEAYKRRGYISMEDENESVSKTLEYAYDDYCIAQMALILSNMRQKKNKGFSSGFDDKYVYRMDADYQKYIARSRSFENLFDAETGFMRPKQNGGFVKSFAPQEVSFHFTEGNSWVYSFFVPQDIPRLIELHGGKERFARKLDELFTTSEKLSGREQPDITGLIGQYAHGNEPSHHIAYLFDYADQPWKTQFYARQIMDEFYKPQPDGLIGNEDCGQMSAWYTLSASGFYEVTPNSAVYAFGTPLFKEVKYNLESGKTFTIKAPNVSNKNIYIKSVRLNGKNYKSVLLSHADIMNGGVLEFEMSEVPVKTAFSAFDFPKSNDKFVAVPLIEGEQRVFNGQNSISLKTITADAKIYYTLDGGEPNTNANQYTKPFVIDKTTQIKAVAVNSSGVKSQITDAQFFKKPNDWTVKILSKYNRQYTGGGDEGLIDGIRGTTNFAAGAWQGYQGQDFIAVIDLQRETEIKKLGGGFLQVARSWIWMPTRITFEVSDDNVNFRKVAEIKTDVAPADMKEQIKDFSAEIAPFKARYVRVKAYNLGKIPVWHPGAGSDAFIFVDEIFIQ